MALQGNLATFSLDEVLQLLAETGKTGTLHVGGPGAAGVLHLADGDLCGAELDHGRDDVAHGLEARILDVCFAFGRLADGDFEFAAARDGATRPVGDALPVAVLLGRLRPLLEDWPTISRVVPSFDVRPALTRELADDVVTIDRASWSVLVKVDGSRSVRDIAVDLDRSAAEVASALRTLVTAGAVTVQGADAPGPLTVVPSPEPEVIVVETPAPPTEGPDALARLDRAALERAALGEPAVESQPVVDVELEPVVDVELEPGADVELEPVVEVEGEPLEVLGTEEPDVRVEDDDERDPVDPEAPHPAVPRDRGALLRMFSALRDG